MTDELRAKFEAWYAENAFDYPSNPIGSRECGLQWKSWQAAHASRDAEVEALKRDAERYRWLQENVQPFRNGNASPHALVKVSLGIGADQMERAFDLIDKTAHVGVVTLNQAIDAAMAKESGE